MKIYSYKKIVGIFFLYILATGCQDFLTEESISNITTDSYVGTEAGYEDLVKSCYPLLRDFILQYPLALPGTDIFQNAIWSVKAVGQGPALDTYVNITSEAFIGPWDIFYREIGRTNAALSRAENVTFANPATKAARVGEVKFLRALSYFYLVQTWGDVPMPLEETVSANKAVVRESSANVYAQIIKDLTEAEADLPVVASNYGRVTKGAAQFLLAKVYLTRGWNFQNSLGGSPADFNKALEYADKVIAAYPLVPQYNTLFPKRSENPLTQYTGAQEAKNSEVVFAIQYNNDVLTNAMEGSNREPGNYYHSIFPGNSDLIGGKGRTSDYNRHLGQNEPSPALYRMFDPEVDSRYSHNFLRVIYALQAVNNYAYSFTDPSLTVSYAVGDTVAYWTPWNKPATGPNKGIDEGGTKKYAVMNHDQIISGEMISRLTAFRPSMWKFWEPNIQYGDGHGTFDFALFRSAEAYLLAAEAIVKGATGGALGGADVYYNKVLDRAVGVGVDPLRAKNPEDLTSMETESYRATPANISIDLILDESARELMGEFNRWFDLKRTGKLVERANKYNFWTKTTGNLSEVHLLRPIPQHEIDRSQPPISQNPGY
ncbi:RagB/SusD family nutrient uptake outer membrane protein [Lunatibacter salilacus]|uniref:RagB/SusD family nutrient uptake outer membrane protein n=1 Tax=Lunatibacter salilacus TaxID=2483804 RepID=UPI00131E2247|nr:RagB/SusD family nutrient uptake outer membrane protein [Lunatibacter salilacus]